MAHQILLRYYNFDKCLLSQTFKYLSSRWDALFDKVLFHFLMNQIWLPARVISSDKERYLRFNVVLRDNTHKSVRDWERIWHFVSRKKIQRLYSINVVFQGSLFHIFTSFLTLILRALHSQKLNALWLIRVMVIPSPTTMSSKTSSNFYYCRIMHFLKPILHITRSCRGIR